MDVKIETNCGRCGRKNEATVSLERASEIVSGDKEKVDALAELTKQIREFDTALLPDAIICTKNADGEYDIETLDNLCELDGKRNKGCKARVKYLVEDIMFRIKHEAPERKTENGEEAPKRKRRTKAEIEADRAREATAN
jgi:hypothetical protein